MTAKLLYRPVGDAGAYPDWLRALKGKSGSYVIRELRWLSDPEVVYVGESHSGRLYQTITRHFQQWRRSKDWWSNFFGGGQQHDPGTTYTRASCEIAVRLTPAKQAIATQVTLMGRLRPRDNVISWPSETESALVPF